jgi:hypothetical protein
MAEIKDVRVWKNPTKTECRIYVHTADGREGCKYITGNPWNPKGSIDGDLTSEEWKAARKVAVWDGAWHTVSENAKPRQFGPEEDARKDIEDLRRLDAQKRQGRGDMEEEYGW